MEPWSADDPWQERRDPSSGWDEWPPQAPAPADYTLEEPDLPASDPWAESWTEEVPGIPERAEDPEFDSGYEQYSEPSPAYEATPTQEAEPPWSEPAWTAPAPVPVEETAMEPEPAEPEQEPMPAPEVESEPAWSQPEPIEAAAPEAEPIHEAEPSVTPDTEPIEPAAPETEPVPDAQALVEPVPEAPHIEPWSPDSDPWGTAWTMPEPVAEPVPEAPLVEPELEPEVEPERAAVEPEAEPQVAAEEPQVAAEEPAAEPEEMPGDGAVAAELEAEPEPGESEAGDVIPAVAAAASVHAWQADIGLAPESERESEAEPEPATEPEPAAEEEPEVAPVWTAEPAVDEEAQAEPVDVAAEADADEAWEADLWTEPQSEAAAPEMPVEEPEVAATAAVEAEESDSSALPEVAAGAAAVGAAMQAGEADELPWPERGDHTEVLPTTWAPPPPPPPSAEATSEPATGEIRTRLGRREPQPEEELGEEPNTAEQAVPWLIGVILLLAGMVIVLLALIFAGDASLGGAAGGTPSPSAAVLVPDGSGDPSAGSSPTARPTPSASPTGSAEPSESTAAVPQYGDLEMIYQGRSAALAPIYLLHRDFTVEGEPEVLAQDASLDVRRFAWSADGTLGAFLYADLMVGIDPGVDVHALTDGISALTFGDDTQTVYAVRVGADGGNDVAVILSIDQATGEERELDRVSYPRPDVAEEAPLAEAQFSDEGGSVRLYWMEGGGLRLWILGGGAWDVHPTDGNATELDDAELPVLWAPDGARRIGLAPSGSETTLRLVDQSGDEVATATVTGRVSHLRWSPRGDQVVFTLGRSAPNGGVLQDLYLWNLGQGDDPAPVMITNTGAAFGAEWRGGQNRWEES